MEVAVIPSMELSKIARVLCTHILCRYGAPTEVPTDQGTEFRGEFQVLLYEDLLTTTRRLGITHRLTA